MPKLKFVNFKAVKAALTMEQVLEHYGLMDKFKRSGDSLNGPCPIHKGSSPTQFRVSVSKSLWHCFSECKHGGNALDFISKMEDVSIHAAALKAIEWFGLDPEAMEADAGSGAEESDASSGSASAPAPKQAARKSPIVPEKSSAPNPPLKFRLDKLERSHPYLAERGLTQETVVDFGIGYCAKGTMEGRIAIPIHSKAGQVVAYAGRLPGEPSDGQPKYRLPQGFRKSQELYNIDRAIKEPPDKPLVIVKGFFDCMKLHQNGCRKIVGLMENSMSAAQEALIHEHADRYRHIIIMLPETEAGRAGREDIAVRLSRIAFVKVHAFEKEGDKPEGLAPEQIVAILEGAL
jgi:DNA primase